MGAHRGPIGCMELRFHITSVTRLYSMHVYMCWNEVQRQYSFTGGFHSVGRGLVSREQAVSAGPPSDNGALQALLPGVTTMPRGSPQRPDPQLPTLQVRGRIGSGEPWLARCTLCEIPFVWGRNQ